MINLVLDFFNTSTSVLSGWSKNCEIRIVAYNEVRRVQQRPPARFLPSHSDLQYSFNPDLPLLKFVNFSLLTR